MAETTIRPAGRALRPAAFVAGSLTWALLALLGAFVVPNLVFFAIHAAHLLTYPYPLDYGEGPLLAQANLLRAGLPFWQLYGDPSAAPYVVVNYPPVYPSLVALLALPPGNTLLVGRLLSLAATLGTLAALWILSAPLPQERSQGCNDGHLLGRLLVVLALLGLPIMREWSVVMRVDLLGICLGLWGLVVMLRRAGTRTALWAAPLLLLSLYTKPSLVAAPAAAALWLLARDWRRGLLLILMLAIGGGLSFGLLQLASHGWFFLHVVTANANEWQEQLARDFWNAQFDIHWPLLAAALLSLLAQLVTLLVAHKQPHGDRRPIPALLLPLIYCLFGALTAAGVGKVGAYTNYFLELYAGLIWLAASVMTSVNQRSAGLRWLMTGGRWLVAGLVAGALVRYYPVWSQTFLKPYGMVEGESPFRLTFGRYGVWRDLQREQDVLQTLGSANAVLVTEIQAAGGPIFTDVPGVAAQAGQLARLQAFEHRQLLDAGAWDQRGLLLELANGRLPLVVLDYLGNWLTPEMISLITRRYAQDGSRGTYDVYRPVDPGPRIALDLRFPDAPALTGYHLAPSPGAPAYHPGETILLTLELARAGQVAAQPYEVVAQLTDGAEPAPTSLLESVRPLLEGAPAPSAWPANIAVQHMQPIPLPAELPAGVYGLAVTLRGSDGELAAPKQIARITVEPGGQVLGENGYYVPPALLDAWEHAGGYAGLGDPLMPAVPFKGFTQQCFTRGCLQLRGTGVEHVPLGELVRLGDLAAATNPGVAVLRGSFLNYWQANGGEAVFGPPITGELHERGRLVQYTRYARLERPAEGQGEVQLGPLGEEFLRLPGGVPYRWP